MKTYKSKQTEVQAMQLHMDNIQEIYEFAIANGMHILADKNAVSLKSDKGSGTTITIRNNDYIIIGADGGIKTMNLLEFDEMFEESKKGNDIWLTIIKKEGCDYSYEHITDFDIALGEAYNRYNDARLSFGIKALITPSMLANNMLCEWKVYKDFSDSEVVVSASIKDINTQVVKWSLEMRKVILK